MEIEAKYVKVRYEGSEDYVDHSELLGSLWIDNEIPILSQVNFVDDYHSPIFKYNDLYRYKFDEKRNSTFDEIADEFIYSYCNTENYQPIVRNDEGLTAYTNIGRSKIISILLDKDVKSVKFMDDDDHEVIVDIEQDYVPFKKLLCVVSAANSEFNLLEAAHQSSDHPHYKLNEGVVTIYNSNEKELYKGFKDLRSGVILGTNERNITI